MKKSEKLHEAMGFTLMGVLKNTGSIKNGKWRDVSWYEKQLNPYPEHPVPFRKKLMNYIEKKKILDDYLLKKQIIIQYEG